MTESAAVVVHHSDPQIGAVSVLKEGTYKRIKDLPSQKFPVRIFAVTKKATIVTKQHINLCLHEFTSSLNELQLMIARYFRIMPRAVQEINRFQNQCVLTVILIQIIESFKNIECETRKISGVKLQKNFITFIATIVCRALRNYLRGIRIFDLRSQF